MRYRLRTLMIVLALALALCVTFEAVFTAYLIRGSYPPMVEIRQARPENRR